jgi:hypothetical protein
VRAVDRLANPAPACLVEPAVDARMAQALQEAHDLFISRLGLVTLAQIAGDFDLRLAKQGMTQADAAARLEGKPGPA